MRVLELHEELYCSDSDYRAELEHIRDLGRFKMLKFRQWVGGLEFQNKMQVLEGEQQLQEVVS